MKKLTREQCGVTSGDIITIRGTVKFAKIDKPVEGKALDRLNQRRLSKGLHETKPFRKITIKNPVVVEGEGTPLAKFYEQYMVGKLITLETKSLFPPTYKQIQNGEAITIEDPQKNPSIGQEISLQISAFQSKGFNYLGSGLNTIIFPEGSIQFYEAVRAEDHLPGFGSKVDLQVHVSGVNTRGLTIAPIFDPDETDIDASSSPFYRVVDPSVSESQLSSSTNEMNDNEPLTAVNTSELKHLKGKSAAKAAMSAVDSPFGKAFIMQNAGDNKKLSQFT
ncbi:hypothetical protein ASD24_29575 [Paenibacillus sp. Root52]|nr:hypothetical protein ASD24_29575 [Paenibacillus sp. Root52]